jgi:hypothetical protein
VATTTSRAGPSDGAVLNFALNLDEARLRGRGRHRLQGRVAADLEQDVLIRTVLLAKGFETPAGAISDARGSLDGPEDEDQGIVDEDGNANIVASDENGIAYSRTPGEVLNIVYLNPGRTDPGDARRTQEAAAVDRVLRAAVDDVLDERLV